MNMKDVKAITIPQGTVKKIENSNGDIIWGSQSAFPYRRLEYVKFSGVNEWAQTIGINSPTATRYYTVTFSYEEAPSPNHGVFLGKYDIAGSAAKNRRLYLPEIQTDGRGRFAIGDKFTSYFDLTPNTKYKSTCNVQSATTLNYLLENMDTSSTVVSGSLTSTGQLANSVSLGIMGLPESTGVLESLSSVVKGKIYGVTYSNNSSTITYHNLIPAQRKSDGVCGFYDPVATVDAEKFIPLTGTNITDSAAGPVVDEYWNLTA